MSEVCHTAHELAEGMLLFGHDGLLGRKHPVLSVALRKHCARTDIFLEQFNWKKSKWHGWNSCLNLNLERL